ncbi:MAG TPA: 16S rRNA (guanine(527)-N(7))-methyltransferase RsmG [Gammaproteobacteria bacterium]|nr:16S rRNA (guanine(527)-N(7))-methyltransferase RsmG [Gammaproteobacteria bacterium]
MSGTAAPGHLLAEGVQALGLELPPGAEARLLAYGELVLHWNRVHNLTSARDAGTFVRRHLLDCLAALPFLTGNSLIDIGSGAGLPGMVFAIARPELRCRLVEPRHKRAAFLHTVRAELGVENAEVLTARMEDLPASGGHDLATARAVTALTELWHLARSHLTPAGRLLALVGQRPSEAITALEAAGLAVVVHRIQVPHLPEARHLVVVGAA